MDLLKIKPTTLAGAIALLRYAHTDMSDGWPDGFSIDLAGHVADTLEAMAS